jgi:hypothetical protein
MVGNHNIRIPKIYIDHNQIEEKQCLSTITNQIETFNDER